MTLKLDGTCKDKGNLGAKEMNLLKVHRKYVLRISQAWILNFALNLSS